MVDNILSPCESDNSVDRRANEELPRLSWSDRRYGDITIHYGPAPKRLVLQLEIISNIYLDAHEITLCVSPTSLTIARIEALHQKLTLRTCMGIHMERLSSMAEGDACNELLLKYVTIDPMRLSGK